MSLLAPPPQSVRRTNRLGLVVVLIISLATTGWTRYLAMMRQEAAAPMGGLAPQAPSSNSLNAMPSFATALLLGGLRGPLVMFLWPTTESHKSAHNLQDVDTEIEWIRLLQPEFDTVHLFQIWNKAYNISVQMSSLHDKYTTILDGIDYGQKVDRERPDDTSIIGALAAVWGDKLSNAAEHVYYRARVRRESQTLIRVSFPDGGDLLDQFKKGASAVGWFEDEAPISHNSKTHRATVFLEPLMAKHLQATFGGAGVDIAADIQESQLDNPSWRRERLDAVLDVDGNLLPSLIQPRYPRPGNVGADDPWYDGSQLQFLKPYQPFPYGISPPAVAYNAYKRAQLLLLLWNEENIQIGDSVIDSRPGISQKQWAIDEWERGRRFEIRMWNLKAADGQSITPATDPDDLEAIAQSTPYSMPVGDDISLQGAIYSYSLAAKLMAGARAELEGHVRRYNNMFQSQPFYVHIDDAKNGEAMMRGDYDYLAANGATGEARKKLLDDAVAQYTAAKLHIALTILKYYTDDQVAAKVFPINPATGQHHNGATIEAVGLTDPTVYLKIFQAAIAENQKIYADPQTGKYDVARDTHHSEREQDLLYFDRCDHRLAELSAAATRGE